jgi:orotate phosphoribosyltransferase
MLDSLAVTLSPRGAQLAGGCVLELLKRFDGRQIATYGLTGVPILQSCVLQDDRYRGLLVRKERKQHGSLKLIEGAIDPSEPVILIDDSVSSGTCMTEATERLEAAGLRVEGGISLVRFGWQNGYALMQQAGYHMETVYDIWDDFIAYMDDEEKPLANPSKYFPAFEWHTEQAPEHLHPAALARLVVSEYLSSGRLLRPPKQLDQKYDSAGGAWVSLRSQASVYKRFARGGFWHFPGEQSRSAAEDVVMASLSTAAGLPAGEEGLQTVKQSAFAVTFFNALERCNPGQLDNDRYGIVVRSLERRQRMGGALPRMPGIVNEWAQFQHARMKNGKLVSFEPYEILRHDVFKVIERAQCGSRVVFRRPQSCPGIKTKYLRSGCGARARPRVGSTARPFPKQPDHWPRICFLKTSTPSTSRFSSMATCAAAWATKSATSTTI